MPVIPATQEAEAEELLEPRRWRLHLPEIAPLHRLRLCLKKRQGEKKKEKQKQATGTDPWPGGLGTQAVDNM